MIKYLKQYADKTFEELVNSLIWFDNPLKLKAIFAKLHTALLADAPIDGKLYGRQDEEWTEIINEEGIPLNGTTAGNPITGHLQFDGNLMLYNTDYSTQAYIGIMPSALQLEIINQSNSSTSEVLLQDGIIKVRTDDSLGLPARGISSDYDYSANITDLDYTQKIYVDGLRGKHISKTTTEINSIVTPQAGETYFNTTLSTLCFFNGTIWQQVTSSVM